MIGVGFATANDFGIFWVLSCARPPPPSAAGAACGPKRRRAARAGCDAVGATYIRRLLLDVDVLRNGRGPWLSIRRRILGIGRLAGNLGGSCRRTTQGARRQSTSQNRLVLGRGQR